MSQRLAKPRYGRPPQSSGLVFRTCRDGGQDEGRNTVAGLSGLQFSRNNNQSKHVEEGWSDESEVKHCGLHGRCDIDA